MGVRLRRRTNPDFETDRAALAAHASLHASSLNEQVGVDAGNGWQRQENGGVWGSDRSGRAQAAVIYIMVNDYHEAIYFIRGTDAKGALFEGRNTYTMTFSKDAPAMDRTRGGFWSLTMYDKDYFMLPNSPNRRTNIGTVNLDANELKLAPDGSLTITISHAQPGEVSCARQLATCAGGVKRTHRAGLCADAAGSRRRLQVAECSAGQKRGFELKE